MTSSGLVTFNSSKYLSLSSIFKNHGNINFLLCFGLEFLMRYRRMNDSVPSFDKDLVSKILKVVLSSYSCNERLFETHVDLPFYDMRCE